MLKALFGFYLAVLTVALPLAARAQCASTADCKGDRTCRAGKCVWASPGCTRDTDCPGRQICTGGACAADAAAATPAPAKATTGLVQPGSTAPQPGNPGATRFMQPATSPPSGVDRGPGTERESIRWLWVTGLVVFGVDYLTGIAVAAVDACDEGKGEAIGLMAIPLAGPFIHASANECSGADGWSGVLISAGVLQLLSATAFIVGLAVKREVPLPSYGLSDDPNGPRLTLLPGAVGRDGFGLNVAVTRF